jgi:hypothetical protein
MCDAKLDFVDHCQPEILSVLQYWQSKCGTRRMPSRADIDPVELRLFIANMLIVEVTSLADGTRDYVYRLVGTREVEARGYDPTGRRVADSFFGRSRDSALRNYEITAEHQRPHFDSVRYMTRDGLQRDDEELFLPLSDDGTTVNRILVYVVTTMVPLREQH